MDRFFTGTLALALCLGLLSGCGGNTPDAGETAPAERPLPVEDTAPGSDSGEETAQGGLTLDDVAAAADLAGMLEGHKNVSYTLTVFDGDQKWVSATEQVFTRNAWGISAYEVTTTPEGADSCAWDYIDGDIPGVTCVMGTSAEERYLYVYPRAEYESYATKWIEVAGQGEVLESSFVQDGEALVMTRRDGRDVTESYALIQYTLDEATGQLKSVYTESYSAVDDSAMGYTLVEVSYDTDWAPPSDPMGVILAQPGTGAHLTVYWKQSAGAPEILELDVEPGTCVLVATAADHTVYTDPEHTQVADLAQMVVEDTELFVVFDR